MAIHGLMRTGAGALIAVPFTIGLMKVMGVLITGPEYEPVEEEQRAEIKLSSDKDDIDVRRRDDAPEPPPESAEPPPPPELDVTKAEKPDQGLATALGQLPGFQTQDVGGQDIQFVVADRDEQPIFRPVTYPPRAAERGTEGQCTVTVDVNADGSVFNPRAECTSSLFVRQVQRDAVKWKYQPRVQDGESVVRRNLRVTVDFVLAD